MATFVERTKEVLQLEFDHSVRPEMDAALADLMEAEKACGFNEYDAAISAIMAILALCGRDRINAPLARLTLAEMSRRIVGVAYLGRRDERLVRRALIDLARGRGADAALMADLAAILDDGPEAGCADAARR